MSRRILALILAVSAQGAPLHAQRARSATSSRDTVDRFVAAEMARKHVPGVSLAVVRGGRVIKAEGYGVADLEHEIPVSPQTVFKIGSVRKQFLAAGIMLLVQDGRLAVDGPVARRFAGAPESWGGHYLAPPADAHVGGAPRGASVRARNGPARQRRDPLGVRGAA